MQTTRLGGTQTAEGYIPHFPNPRGFAMPVAVRTTLKTYQGPNGEVLQGPVCILKDSMPYPERTSAGNVIYALPGGGRFAP